MATVPAQASASTTASSREDRSFVAPLLILASLFFMWGFLTCLNDVLLPHLKSAFSLNYVEATLIQFCFFSAYFAVSLPAGWFVKHFGYQRGIVVGLIIAAVGCALFYPAAAMRAYPIFLASLFILGSGITLLQVSANPYVTVLGSPETASARLNTTQALNSFATVVAPFFGHAFILKESTISADDLARLPADQIATLRLSEAASVQMPYVGLAVVLALMALGMGVVKLPVVTDDVASSVSGGAWGHRHLVLGAVGIFVYVGAEVSIGSFLVNFMGLKEVAGLSGHDATLYLSYYWGGAMVGRVIGSLLLWFAKPKPGRVLAFNAVAAAVLAVASMLLTGHAAMWALLAVGLFNSIMFPTIFSLALGGLGADTAQGSGILCMAIVGGAVLPLLCSAIADAVGLRLGFVVPALCYLYIVFYGLKGSEQVPPVTEAKAA